MKLKVQVGYQCNPLNLSPQLKSVEFLGVFVIELVLHHQGFHWSVVGYTITQVPKCCCSALGL